MLNKELLMMGGGKPLITFKYVRVPDKELYAEAGMTWLEFVDSPYNEPSYVDEYGFWKFTCFNETRDVVDTSYRSDGSLSFYGPSVTLTIGEYRDNTNVVKGSDKIIAGHTYGFGVCYAAGTLITLHDGTTKKIEDITYDDDLLVWDFDNGCFATAKPSWITKAQRYPYYYKITLDDGTQLDLIGSNGDCHRLFNVEQSKFVYGSRFNLGEHTFKQDKSTPKVVSIELVYEEVEYYNLITKEHLNCFINGVLSSCRYNNLYPIEDMKFVKSDRGLVPHNVYSRVPLKYYNDLRLGEVDTSEFSIEETMAYVDRLIKLRA